MRAQYRQLNERGFWQKYATIPILFILGLIMVVAPRWFPAPALGLASLPQIVWMIFFAVALPGISPGSHAALVMTPLMRRNYRLAVSENGLCPICGYDLRATPDRCPECGAVPRVACTTIPLPPRPLHNESTAGYDPVPAAQRNP